MADIRGITVPVRLDLTIGQGANALDELVARVDRLEPSDRLRLAAALVDAGRFESAETIARAVVDALAFSPTFAPRPT